MCEQECYRDQKSRKGQKTHRDYIKGKLNMCLIQKNGRGTVRMEKFKWGEAAEGEYGERGSRGMVYEKALEHLTT